MCVNVLGLSPLQSVCRMLLVFSSLLSFPHLVSLRNAWEGLGAMFPSCVSQMLLCAWLLMGRAFHEHNFMDGRASISRNANGESI